VDELTEAWVQIGFRLANVSPTLLASGKDWRNTNYALGNPPTKKDFKPSSVASAEVFSMLNELLPDFAIVM
jgi:hypothetical protein